MVLSWIFLVILPLIISGLGIYFGSKFGKTKKANWIAGFVVGFGLGWLIVGIKYLLEIG